MSWNEPGKPDQDPWNDDESKRAKKNNNTSNKSKPNNLSVVIDFITGNSNNNGGNNDYFQSKIGIGVIVLVVLILWLLSGIYIVDPAERGVELRFGAFKQETTSGPHWHIPYPIETVTIVNVDQIRTAEIGYRATRGKNSAVSGESLMLTKDENIVDIEIATQYKVESANQYLFSVADPDLTLRAVVESALREVVGKNKMDFVLTEGRNEVVVQVKDLAQSKLKQYKTGLIITSVNLQDAQPPEQVQASFADVVKAREDRERLINEAEAYANGVIPVSRGQAARLLEEASAYHDRVIAQAMGEADRFKSIVFEYKKAPKIMRNRLYLEAVTNVLSNSSKILMSNQNNNSLLYLPLDKIIGSSQKTKRFSLQIPQNENGQKELFDNSGQNNSIQKRKSVPRLRDYLRNRELR